MPRHARAPISLLLLARQFSAAPSSPAAVVACKFWREGQVDRPEDVTARIRRVAARGWWNRAIELGDLGQVVPTRIGSEGPDRCILAVNAAKECYAAILAAYH